MFHRQLLDSTEAKKLIERNQKPGFVRLTIYFNETPSCR